MIYNNIYGEFWLSQVVMLDIKGLKNYKKFFVICIVVEFYNLKYTGVECNKMYLIFFCHNWQYSYKSIIWDISFHNYLSVKDLVGKDWSRYECFFKDIECFPTL